jgi:hypothetical protein
MALEVNEMIALLLILLVIGLLVAPGLTLGILVSPLFFLLLLVALVAAVVFALPRFGSHHHT